MNANNISRAFALAVCLCFFLPSSFVFSQSLQKFHKIELKTGDKTSGKLIGVTPDREVASFERDDPKAKRKTLKIKLSDRSFAKAAGKGMPIEELTERSQKLVKNLVGKWFEKQIDELNREIKNAAWAHERLDLYRKKIKLVDPNDADKISEIKTKIEVLEPLAAKKAIVYGAKEQYLPIEKLKDERKRAGLIIDDWVSSKNYKDKRRLHLLVKDNPLCTEAHSTLAILLGVSTNDFDQAERRLKTALEISRRYFVDSQSKELANDAAIANHIALLNNYAVFQIRRDNPKAAARTWSELYEFCNALTPEARHNLAKLRRMLKGKQGISMNKASDERELHELVSEVGAVYGRAGGWQLMLPVRDNGQPRKLDFLIGGKVRMHGNVICDTRCLNCSGAGKENCQNEAVVNDILTNCTNGFFRQKTTIVQILPNGQKSVRPGPAKRITCKRCSGTGAQTCHICRGSGTQNN